MEKAVEERFERIERNLELINAVQLKQVEAQLRLTESVTAINQSVVAMNESITRYADASNARMAEIEQNLKDLINAITSEHKNGKGK